MLRRISVLDRGADLGVINALTDWPDSGSASV